MTSNTKTKIKNLLFISLGTVIVSVHSYYRGFLHGKEVMQQKNNAKKEIKTNELPKYFQNNDTLQLVIHKYNTKGK